MIWESPRTLRPVPFPTFTANTHLNCSQPRVSSIWRDHLLISMHQKMMAKFEWQDCIALLEEDCNFRVPLYVHKDGSEGMRMNLHIGMLV